MSTVYNIQREITLDENEKLLLASIFFFTALGLIYSNLINSWFFFTVSGPTFR